jgi:lysophospholipase L1-like esterase
VRPGEIVIWVTGGSTMFGLGLFRNEDTVPAQLQAWLRAKAESAGFPNGGSIHVINGGVPGYNAAEEVKAFLYDLAFRHPRMWIQVTGVNEAWHFGKLRGSRDLFKNKYLEGFGEKEFALVTPFFPATQTLLRRWVGLLRPGRAAHFRRFQAVTEQPDFEGSVAARLAGLAESARAMAQAQGVRYAFFLQPTQTEDAREVLPGEASRRREWFSDDDWRRQEAHSHAFFGEMRRWLARRGGDGFFDLSHAFDGRKEEIYLDPRHYNPRGSRILAEKIGTAIWRRQVLPMLRAAGRR